MSIKAWISKLIGAGGDMTEVTIEEIMGTAGEIYVRELAFCACVNIAANAISKCEFKTYVKNKEVKGAEYYLWNYEPNKNQNSSQFIKKWIYKLFRENEVLIIENNGQLLVADSFSIKEYALYENIFSSVRVGDYTFNRSFAQSEVLYYKLSEKNMWKVTAGIYAGYKQLLEYGMRSYKKSRGHRGIVKVDTMAYNTDKEKYKNLINRDFKAFFENENGIMPLFDGYDYTELNGKTYNNDSTRDIRAMIDDITDFTARGFGMPAALVNGTAGTENAVEQLLTFFVDPLTDMFEEEIVRKRYGRKSVLEGTYLTIYTNCIKHIDLLSVSTAIDKLISSGVFCVNDILKMCGETTIDEEWANKHFITKNYSSIEELLKAIEGGEMKI